jgi:hypothetical protein
MNVLLYPDPSSPAPSRVQLVYPANDTLEEFAFKFLDPEGIEYVIVDQSELPDASYIYNMLLVEIVDGAPVFSYDVPAAKEFASAQNSQYWQTQYNEGLLGLSITNDYQLQLACATPEDERTADQVAAVEFMIGLSSLQADVQTQIDAATTGEEIISILSQLG